MAAREQSAYRLARLIKRARRQMTNAIRVRLEPIGTSLPVVQVMRRVAEGGPINQIELARQIELEPAAVCRLLVELESTGLVARRRDADDNRRVLVVATVSGQAWLARARPHVLAGIDEMVSRLTRSEQAELSRLLSKMAPDDDERSAERGGGVPCAPYAAARPLRRGSAKG